MAVNIYIMYIIRPVFTKLRAANLHKVAFGYFVIAGTETETGTENRSFKSWFETKINNVEWNKNKNRS